MRLRPSASRPCRAARTVPGRSGDDTARGADAAQAARLRDMGAGLAPLARAGAVGANTNDYR